MRWVLLKLLGDLRRSLAMNFEESVIIEVSGVTKEELAEIKREK